MLFIVMIVGIMVIIDRVFKIVADIIWYKLGCGNKQQPIKSNNKDLFSTEYNQNPKI